MLRNYQKTALQRSPLIGFISLVIGFRKNKPSIIVNCDCCGNPVSNLATNEAMPEFWICNKCFIAWEADGKQTT